MIIWAKSENEHIRRLASQGCRPRLPWAIALEPFKNNPQLVLTLTKNWIGNNQNRDWILKHILLSQYQPENTTKVFTKCE